MATGDNTDSIIWVPGETSGKTGEGVPTSAPQGTTDLFLVTGSGIPDNVAEWSSVENAGFYLDGSDLYVWNGAVWIGPYTV